MTENEKWIKQSCEREELAKKLIEMGVKDIDEFDELKNVPVEILQTWIIEALEEDNNKLRENIPILAEAKEIIKTLLAIVNNDVEYVQNPQDCKDLWKELCENAETFLKEIKNKYFQN